MMFTWGAFGKHHFGMGTHGQASQPAPGRHIAEVPKLQPAFAA